MPLVVPGLTPQSNSSSNNDSQSWHNKLMGKKIGEATDTTTFAKKELPQSSRIVEHGGMMTMDHNPDRMNVHLGEDGTVRKVTHG